MHLPQSLTSKMYVKKKKTSKDNATMEMKQTVSISNRKEKGCGDSCLHQLIKQEFYNIQPVVLCPHSEGHLGRISDIPLASRTQKAHLNEEESPAFHKPGQGYNQVRVTRL